MLDQSPRQGFVKLPYLERFLDMYISRLDQTAQEDTTQVPAPATVRRVKAAT